jgi:hypothetical protein
MQKPSLYMLQSCPKSSEGYTLSLWRWGRGAREHCEHRLTHAPTKGAAAVTHLDVVLRVLENAVWFLCSKRWWEISFSCPQGSVILIPRHARIFRPGVHYPPAFLVLLRGESPPLGFGKGHQSINTHGRKRYGPRTLHSPLLAKKRHIGILRSRGSAN